MIKKKTFKTVFFNLPSVHWNRILSTFTPIHPTQTNIHSWSRSTVAAVIVDENYNLDFSLDFIEKMYLPQHSEVVT